MKKTLLILILLALTSCGWLGRNRQSATKDGQPATEAAASIPRIRKDTGPITLPYDASLEEGGFDGFEFKELYPSDDGLGALQELYNYSDYGEEDPKVRYVPLPSKGGADIILVEQDNDRLWLLVMKGGEITGELYVFGVERDVYSNAEETILTSFAIDEDYRITVRTDDKSSGYRGEPYTTRHWWISGEGELLDVDHFVYEGDWEGVRCRQWTEEGYGFPTTQESIFPGATLAQVYDIVKRIDPYLATELPASDTQYTADEDNNIGVVYRYENPGHLLAEVNYEGGQTYIEMEEKGGEIRCVISYLH